MGVQSSVYHRTKQNTLISQFLNAVLSLEALALFNTRLALLEVVLCWRASLGVLAF